MRPNEVCFCLTDLFSTSQKPIAGTDENQNRQVIPDCVVVRKLIRGLSEYVPSQFLSFDSLPVVKIIQMLFMD